jgi:hypothetical protein
LNEQPHPATTGYWSPPPCPPQAFIVRRHARATNRRTMNRQKGSSMPAYFQSTPCQSAYQISTGALHLRVKRFLCRKTALKTPSAGAPFLLKSGRFRKPQVES